MLYGCVQGCSLNSLVMARIIPTTGFLPKLLTVQILFSLIMGMIFAHHAWEFRIYKIFLTDPCFHYSLIASVSSV